MENAASRLGGALAGGEVNVGSVERVASLFGGGFLAGAGLKRGGAAGAMMGLAGAILLHRGATGRCHVYGALGVDTAGGTASPERGAMPATGEVGAVHVEASIIVNRMAEELYRYWRDFTHAPSYMDRILAVRVVDERTSRWTAEGPRGRAWEWTSEVTEDVPNRRIAWHTLPGSDLPNRGSVEFTPGRIGETVVRYTVEFLAPGGVVGQAIASAFHQMPEKMIQEDLRRFKTVMEAGMEVDLDGTPTASAT